jgi:hypothetical protein
MRSAIKIHLLLLVGILFPHIIDDARSKPHQNLSDITIYFHRSSFSICLKNALHSASIIFYCTLHSIEHSVLSIYLFTHLFLFHTTESLFLLHSLCNVMKYSKKETKFSAVILRGWGLSALYVVSEKKFRKFFYKQNTRRSVLRFNLTSVSTYWCQYTSQTPTFNFRHWRELLGNNINISISRLLMHF